ncbi:DUF3558 domain-containing protein [Nocardia sp. NPDC050175]|uniref:DUF3558 domain-containing protein n=1 Tax=Nocardia sp. NPDC050175 TaxID=3364317 RepID=UPI0037887BE8
MLSRGNKLRAITLALGVTLALAGCQDGNDGPPSTSTTSGTAPSLAADVPHGFDPCTGIPADVLASENLKATGRDDTGKGGVMWRGCGWVVRGGNGYSVAITTSNITLDSVRAKHFTDTQEFTSAGRRATSSREDLGDSSCVVNVEMKGGSLDLLVDNPKSAPDTGQMDACQIARTLADKVAPAIPAGA